MLSLPPTTLSSSHLVKDGAGSDEQMAWEGCCVDAQRVEQAALWGETRRARREEMESEDPFVWPS